MSLLSPSFDFCRPLSSPVNNVLLNFLHEMIVGLWFLVQRYIITGKSKKVQPPRLFGHSCKALLIIGVASLSIYILANIRGKCWVIALLDGFSLPLHDCIRTMTGLCNIRHCQRCKKKPAPTFCASAWVDYLCGFGFVCSEPYTILLDNEEAIERNSAAVGVQLRFRLRIRLNWTLVIIKLIWRLQETKVN
jgi:hypothetical protein